MAHLCHHLATITGSGIPIRRALTLLLEESHGRSYRRILLPMSDTIQRGGTLADAMRAESKYFPEAFIEMVIAGETAGQTAEVLKNLAAHYDEVLRLQRQFIQGAIYPIMIVLTIVVFIPYAHGLLFSTDSVEMYTLKFAGRLIAGYGPTFFVLVILGRLGILQRIIRPISYRLWPFGKLQYSLALARFCKCMSVLLDAGVGLSQTIERSAAATAHPRLRRALRTAVPMVQQGATLHEALSSAGVLPEMVRSMVHVGEESGKDAELLDRAAYYLYEEALHPVRTAAIGFEGYLILAGFLLYILGGIVQRAVAVLVQLAAISL
jgi:type IV pilus assembly protein PilC